MQYSAKGIVSGVGLGLFMLIAACASQLHKAQEMTPQGDAFSRSLASGYLEMAETSFDEGEHRRSERFANKSIVSASGKPSQPSKPSDYNLKNGSQDLEAARIRLMNLLDGSNARVEMPEKAASAQANYDCWLERKANNDIETPQCHSAFEKDMRDITLSEKSPSPLVEGNDDTFSITYDLARDAMNPIGNDEEVSPAGVSKKHKSERYLGEKSPEKAPKKSVKQSTPNPVGGGGGGNYHKGLVFDASKWGNPAKSYTLYFNTASTSITEEADLILADIAKELLSNPYKLIRIEGYTDLAGDERSNLALSFKRALAADKGLIKAISGKSPPRSIDGKGEQNAVVKGAEGLKSVKNRRVKIMLF